MQVVLIVLLSSGGVPVPIKCFCCQVLKVIHSDRDSSELSTEYSEQK